MKFRKYKCSLALWFFAFVLAYLAAAWLAFFSVDVFNVANSRGSIKNLPFTDQVLVFIWLFEEGGPTEILQWASNICSLGLCFYLAILHDKKDEVDAARTFRIGAAGFSLLVLEDMGNVRHFFALSIRDYLSGTMNYGGEGRYVHTIVELTLYSLISVLMIYFFLRFYPVLKKISKAHFLLVLGYVFYAIAAFASATRNIGNWYEHVGSILVSLVCEDMNDVFLSDSTGYIGYPLGFWIMDFLLEESLELIAASAILTTILLYADYLKKHSRLHTQ